MKFAAIALIGATNALQLSRWGYDKDHKHPGFTANMADFDGNWSYERDDPKIF